MAGFKGQAEYSVDSKGRVTIPAKMRDELSPEADGTFTVTRGFDQCVYLYPLDTWTEMEENEIANLSRYDREARHFVRIIMRWAEEVALDAQGRIKLPSPLIDFAEIDGEGRIIGAFDHVEIWAPKVFDQYMNEQPVEYETLAERVMSG
ncbi:MAG: division/cell wall cluster transcriptional repressor MraZ [Bacteroidetes bacterium QS_9_68_14]|nr:MAG: division/cell wall cluster transcriptional repressor MraZ [Bacteroidetes bacterium QS_9_68_14]